MKLLILTICSCLFGAAVMASTFLNANQNNGSRKLGAKQCTWGPSYWCSNITNAKTCNAVQHCIQTVWEKQTVPEDTDSICQICLDMVKQARDQLESNETREDIKAVFEGSCKLIPIKSVRKECIKLADEFAPELIASLASQMNPQVVCSVAGLCNNAAIDKLLEKLMIENNNNNEPQSAELPPPSTHIKIPKSKLSCRQCDKIGTIITRKFLDYDRDDLLEYILWQCGELSSFSEGCANIVLTYFNEMYDHLRIHLNSNNICHMSGVCTAKFHLHDEIDLDDLSSDSDDVSDENIEIRPLSNVGVVAINEDIPCELCEQLIKHLRDVLIANTTEDEFKKILVGFCKQSHGFEDECISIVEQYYDVIYKALVNNLDANGACYMMGVCPKGLRKNNDDDDDVPIMPLLPLQTPQDIIITLREKPKRKLLGEGEPKLTANQIQNAQLPIDVLLGAPNAFELVHGGELCTLCEYFLHFVQEALASPTNEERIKDVVSKTCTRLPKTIGVECQNFVSMYGDAIIALLIQDINPRELCPLLHMCPRYVKDVEIFAPKPIDVTVNTHNSGTEKCPLCLFAVAAALNSLKTDKTKDNVKRVLDSLCEHLPSKIQFECTDFVSTYTSELMDMLAGDFQATEICVYLRCCDDKKPDLSTLNIDFDDDDDTNEMLTNEIPDNTVNGVVAKQNDDEYFASANCILCEQVIKEVEKRIIHNRTKEEIKAALLHACDRLHKLRNKCNNIIQKHGDQIVDLILKEMSPKIICKELGYCIVRYDNEKLFERYEPMIETGKYRDGDIMLSSTKNSNGDISMKVSDTPLCTLCEFIMVQLEKDLTDKKTEKEIEDAVKNICKIMPNSIRGKCNDFITQYAETIIHLIATLPPKEICSQLQLCMSQVTESKKDVLECAICHATVEGIVKVLEDPKNSRKLADITEKVCNMLPGRYHEQCVNLLDVYGPSMLHIIINLEDGKTVCSQIGMCFRGEHASMIEIGETKRRVARSPVELVGANECTWGPTHWCSKQEIAEKCGTFNYCVERVWVNGVPPESAKSSTEKTTETKTK